MGKIVSQKELLRLRPSWRHKKQVVVFTNGCFDIIHRGHVEYLAQAKKLGDILIVALNSDRSVSKLKGRGRPVIKLCDREFLMSHLDMVDYVTSFASSTPKALITKLLPDILVKGGDYRPEEIVGAEEVKAAGGEVKVLRYVKDRSSSALLRRIASRENTS